MYKRTGSENNLLISTFSKISAARLKTCSHKRVRTDRRAKNLSPSSLRAVSPRCTFDAMLSLKYVRAHVA